MEWLTANEIAERIRARTLTSLQCVNFFADRIERLDSWFNLVVVRLFDQARARAKEADAAVDEGRFWGPLHGVPMTVKECLSMTGVPTTAGMPSLKESIPDRDSAVVEKLLAAGAIIMGKTNISEQVSDYQSYNPIYGTSNNPWNVGHSPGGSSGGSAGALAAGFTPLEVGGETVTSLRGPAHCCGIFAHSPSGGILDPTGLVPTAPFDSPPPNLAVVGPLARCSRDLAFVLEILLGPPKHLQDAWAVRLRPSRVNHISKLRIAVCIDHDFCPVEQAISTSIKQAAKSLAMAGASVNFDARPDFDFGETLRYFLILYGGERLDQPSSAAISHLDYMNNEKKRIQIKQKWAEFFKTYDVFFCPVANTAALKHDHSQPLQARMIDRDGAQVSYLEWMKWCGLVGFADLPVTVVPIGKTSTGLPIGVQVVAPAFQDLTSIHVALLLEQYHSRFEPPKLDIAKL